MKLVNFALGSLLVLGVSSVGCSSASNGDDEGTLGTAADELVADADEAQDTDGDVESGVDEPLSGGTAADPGAPADGATDAEVVDKVKSNAGAFFTPAGCLVTTISGNTATHVFTNCTGPNGMKTFNGTVTSTYERTATSLTITHEATSFQVNGATVSGQRVVVYTKSGTVITKTRTGTWSGTTAKGKPISHTANFTSTYDGATKCVTRDGSATTAIGGRELTIAISGFKRCGGRLACPESGTLTLTRTKAGETATATVVYIGAGQVEITGPAGRKVVRRLFCKVS